MGKIPKNILLDEDIWELCKAKGYKVSEEIRKFLKQLATGDQKEITSLELTKLILQTMIERRDEYNKKINDLLDYIEELETKEQEEVK